MQSTFLTLMIFVKIFLTLNVLANPTNLTIRIKGYDYSKHKNYIDIRIPSINNPFIEQIKISEQGHATTTLLIPTIQEVIISYDNRSVPVLISPRDNLELEIEIDELLKRGSQPAFSIKGINRDVNTLILNNNYLIESWIGKSTNAFKADKSISVLEYRSLREQEMKVQLANLQVLKKENNINNEVFLDWAESKIRYAAGKDYCLFPFMGRINKNITEDDEYFDYIKDFYPKNKFITITEYYSEYLKTLITSLEIIGNISEKYKQKREDLQKDSLSYFPVNFNIILNKLEGDQRKAALTYIFLNTKKIPPSYIDSLNNYLPLSELSNIEARNKFSNTPILELLNSYTLTDEEKKPIADLYKSAEGKIIFHDFWFLACAPCMVELPYYNKLVEEAGDDIEFIFFGVYMDEKKWKDGLKKYQLKGKHHLLTKNQLAFFERYFNLQGFPHHQLINKDGIITSEHLPRVDPANFQTISKAFEKLKNNQK